MFWLCWTRQTSLIHDILKENNCITKSYFVIPRPRTRLGVFTSYSIIHLILWLNYLMMEVLCLSGNKFCCYWITYYLYSWKLNFSSDTVAECTVSFAFNVLKIIVVGQPPVRLIQIWCNSTKTESKLLIFIPVWMFIFSSIQKRAVQVISNHAGYATGILFLTLFCQANFFHHLIFLHEYYCKQLLFSC